MANVQVRKHSGYDQVSQRASHADTPTKERSWIPDHSKNHATGTLATRLTRMRLPGQICCQSVLLAVSMVGREPQLAMPDSSVASGISFEQRVGYDLIVHSAMISHGSDWSVEHSAPQIVETSAKQLAAGRGQTGCASLWVGAMQPRPPSMQSRPRGPARFGSSDAPERSGDSPVSQAVEHLKDS